MLDNDLPDTGMYDQHDIKVMRRDYFQDGPNPGAFTLRSGYEAHFYA